jgi:hypothetical protein
MSMDKIAAAAVLVGTLAGCASSPRLASAPALSKSKGTVHFKSVPDRGTLIVLKVKNLAEPETLNPPGYSYVAWVQNDREAPPQNLGALRIDGDLKGVLRTTTSLRDFEFFVTVEAASDAQRPTGPPLLWTHRDDRMTLVRRDEWTRFSLSDAR